MAVSMVVPLAVPILVGMRKPMHLLVVPVIWFEFVCASGFAYYVDVSFSVPMSLPYGCAYGYA